MLERVQSLLFISYLDMHGFYCEIFLTFFKVVLVNPNHPFEKGLKYNFSYNPGSSESSERRRLR